MQTEDQTQTEKPGTTIKPMGPTDTSEVSAESPEAETPQPSGPKKRRLSLSRKQLIITSAVLLVLIGGAVAAYLLTKKKPVATTNDQTASQTKPSDQATVSTDQTDQVSAEPVKLDSITTISGNTYLATPKRLPDLHFYLNLEKYFGNTCDENGKNCKPAVVSSDIKYYQIGTTKDGKQIIAYSEPAVGPGGDTIYAAIETSAGKFTVLYYPSAQQSDVDSYKSNLTKNITVTNKSVLAESIFKNETTIKNDPFISSRDSTDRLTGDGKDYVVGQINLDGLKGIRGSYFGDISTSAITKVSADGSDDIYRVVAVDKDGFETIEYYSSYKTLFSTAYYTNDEITSQADKKEPITWTKGSNNQSEYFTQSTGLSGCGANGYESVKDVSESQVIQVGITDKGTKLYQLPTSNSAIKKLFTDDYAKGQMTEDKSLQNLTIQQLSDVHGYFLVKNSLGDWMLFLRSDLFSGGGCGKPVIYLYPTHETSVSVKVGADVVKSDPTYGDGWQNVLAEPSGALQYQGKSYDSLFWEGYGFGRYPAITSGTVVPTSQAIATIRQQLAAQGLNSKEINDFVDYWGPKMPNKPYVRLTWLGTSTMNQLAPLRISPTPQSLIRVFLDFDGLDKPINIPKQTLVKLPRDGFTVVEWGGLVRGRLQ